LCRPWLEEAPVWRTGDRLLDDRGGIDGATRSARQRQRQVEVLIPLTATRLATQAALQRAERAHTRQPHPSRADPTIALVGGVEQRWTAWEVPLHACVLRLWHKQKTCTDPLVLLTPDLQRSASWSVRHYAERPERAPDEEQRNSGGGQRQKLRSTRERAMVLSVLTVVCSSSRYHRLTNRQAGVRWADTTRQALALAPLRPQRTPMSVYAGGFFAIFETRSVAHGILQLPAAAQDQLRHWLDAHLHTVQKRE
jgi:hypothetical protein